MFIKHLFILDVGGGGLRGGEEIRINFSLGPSGTNNLMCLVKKEAITFDTRQSNIHAKQMGKECSGNIMEEI